MKKYSSSPFLPQNIKLLPPSSYLKYPSHFPFNKESSPQPFLSPFNKENRLEPEQKEKNGKKEEMRKGGENYSTIKQKINNLEERLGKIRRNYDILQNNRMKRSIKESQGLRNNKKMIRSLNVENQKETVEGGKEYKK